MCGTDGSELCSLLALGVQPVGYGRRNEEPQPWLSGRIEDLDDYDLTSGEVQYERLVAWQPDLLLVQQGFATAETMPRYRDIAPTVATSFIDWRDNLRQVSEALGLAPLPAQQAEGEASDQLSLEQLDRIDGDLLLFQHYGEGDGADQLQATALWQGLDVVRAGRVVDLTEDEFNQLYFDAVLTVEPNLALLERVLRPLL